jgi:hypothetical protein
LIPPAGLETSYTSRIGKLSGLNGGYTSEKQNYEKRQVCNPAKLRCRFIH